MIFLLLLAFAFFNPASENANNLQAGHGRLDVFLALQKTMGDLGSFCQRNPETCQTGHAVAAYLGIAARDGAKMIYEFLDEQFSSSKTEEIASDITGAEAS